MNEATNEQRGTSLRRFKPYPAYKDSGVEWLGEIPAHWEVMPIRSLARPGYRTFVDGDWIESPFIRDEGIRLVQTGNVGIGAYKEQGFRYIDDETFRAFRCTEVLPGDVLICRLADPVGRACIAPDLGCRMITSVDVCILKTGADVDAAFVVYALSGGEYLSWMSGICRGGTRDRVSRSMLGSIRVQKPPLHEQRAIAGFLDRGTAEIDALVAKKKRLIELLQEKRTALITRAVTKGLDPTVPMKDSGVEWLGEIPAHWEVKRLKRVFRVVNGSTPASGEPEYWDGDIPWVTPEDLGDLSGTVIGVTRRSITESGYRSCGTTLVPPGSLVLSTRAPIGHLAVAGVNLCTNQGCRSLVFRNEAWRRFFFYELLAARPELESLGQGSTFRELAKGLLEDVVLAQPSSPEQRAIAAFLDRETARIDALVSKVRDAINRLKELRTALISAAVTGKIDVREEAA